MRPVDKGAAPRVYTDYGQARHDLAERIGYYCSYCEMKIYNSIEVEHILPQNQGGNAVDWGNLLLSCRYCNTIKSDHNDNLSDYLWPDRDNTDLAFDYSETNVIQPKTTITPAQRALADRTINLTGLNRIPSGINEPTEADTRWRSRQEVWDMAKRSLLRWEQAPVLPHAQTIADMALIAGHYCIWIEVFKDIRMVLDEIDNIYRTNGLFKEFEPHTNIRKIRENGQI